MQEEMWHIFLGDKWCWQTAYKILALVMLFIGGIAAYHIVWDLGDVGIGLMTIFNIVTLYEGRGKEKKKERKKKKQKEEERENQKRKNLN